MGSLPTPYNEPQTLVLEKPPVVASSTSRAEGAGLHPVVGPLAPCRLRADGLASDEKAETWGDPGVLARLVKSFDTASSVGG